MAKEVTEEMINELVEDFDRDGGLHLGVIFHDWRQRHGLHVAIKEVSPFLNLAKAERELL